MGVLTLVIAVTSLLIGGYATVVAKRSATAADRSARAAEATAQTAKEEDRRARKPVLEVELPERAYANQNIAIFTVRNLGPQDLDTVVIHQPQTDDDLEYQIAITDVGMWDSRVEIAPLAINECVQVTLACGLAAELPTFRLRIECSAGEDKWILSHELPEVRSPVVEVTSYVDLRLKGRR